MLLQRKNEPNTLYAPDYDIGFVVYEGPSAIDGSPIVAVVTTESKNRKTSGLPQPWIMRQDMAPQEAVKTGQDRAVCGDCKGRAGAWCYVLVFQGPRSVYDAWKRGRYPRASYEQIMGLKDLRRAAYGDDCALPATARNLLATVSGTGYTAGWRTNLPLRSTHMASVGSLAEAREAWRDGWRTFRRATDYDVLAPNEIRCPAYTKGMTCADCMLCVGTRSQAKSIVIPKHGAKAFRPDHQG